MNFFFWKGEDEDAPPTPPQRVESLSPNRRGPKPPPPPRKHFADEVSQDEPVTKQTKLDSATEVPQKPERETVEEKVNDIDSGNASNDSRTLPSDGRDENRQHDKQDSENNNPKKEEEVTEGGESRGGGNEGVRGEDGGQDEQTGNFVSESSR